MSKNEVVAEATTETALATTAGFVEVTPVQNFDPFAMDEDSAFIAKLTTRTQQFCSLKADTLKEKARMFTVMNNPEKRIKDCINEVIYAKDLFVEVVELVSEKTGEMQKCPRIVIVDKDGVGYQAVSIGIYSALRKLITIYGAPTWAEPLALKVKLISKGDRSILTFDVVS